MEKTLLMEAIELTETRVNFRCLNQPDRNECKGCTEETTCDMECITWDCKHNLVGFTEALGSIGVDNKEDYLQFARDNGGYCDCEIIFNVKDSKALKKLEV